MARWTRDISNPRYTWTQDGVRFEFDTAAELGRMMVESGIKIQNPYEPNTVDYDNFTAAVIAARNPQTDEDCGRLEDELCR